MSEWLECRITQKMRKTLETVGKTSAIVWLTSKGDALYAGYWSTSI